MTTLPVTNEPLLTTAELANELRLSERTIVSLKKRLKLPHFKIGKSVRYQISAVLGATSK